MILHQRLRLKLKSVWPCCTMTPDRHAEEETPNKATEKDNKETSQSSAYFPSS